MTAQRPSGLLRAVIVLALILAVTIAAANNHDVERCLRLAGDGVEAQACVERAGPPELRTG